MIKTKIRRRYSNGGDKIKLYAKRCPTSEKQYYHADKATMDRLAWISNVYEVVLGLKLSSSIIIRRAMLSLYMDVIDLLMNPSGSTPEDFEKYLDNLEKERALLYECANTTVAALKVLTDKNKSVKKSKLN